MSAAQQLNEADPRLTARAGRLPHSAVLRGRKQPRRVPSFLALVSYQLVKYTCRRSCSACRRSGFSVASRLRGSLVRHVGGSSSGVRRLPSMPSFVR